MIMKKSLPKYYVYEIWDPVEKVCRYVGKGHGKRVKDQSNPERITNKRLQQLVESRRKEGFFIEPKIVYRHNIEADALRKEMALIAKYGRHGVDPNGTLFNITSGGQGIVGRGKPITIAEIPYSTIKEAADAYDINESTLRRRLTNGWLPEEAVGLIERAKIAKKHKQVKVAGIIYPSQAEACRAFAISNALVISRLKRGWTTEEAYGAEKHIPKQNRSITVDGIHFDSAKEAAAHFNVKPDTALARINRGWSPEEAFGVRKRQRADKPHTESDIIDIRKRRAKGQTSQEIAKYYGIDSSSVSRICYGESYSGFGGPIVTTKKPIRNLLSPEEVREIRYAKKAGGTNKKLAEKYEIDSSCVSNICTGKSYKKVDGPIITGQRRLKKIEVQKIRKERWGGKTLKEISEAWNLHLETVRRVCSKK